MKAEICLPDLDYEEIDENISIVLYGRSRDRKRNVELKDLVVYEQLTKPIGEYKLISPHISAAKKLIHKGIGVNAGSVVGFVIEKGADSISEKAQPIEFAQLEKIDTDYYINHQILPASLRILMVLGVGGERLLEI